MPAEWKPLKMNSQPSKSRSPRSSLVLAAHGNFAHMLPKALASVRAQTRPAEAIVVNNGASRRVSAVLGDFPWVREVVLKEHAPLGTASNAGIAAATTPYVMRLDADDWLDETIIEQLETVLDEHGVDCAWCDYFQSWPMPWGQWFHDIKEQHHQVLSCGALYRKSAWQQIEGYNENMHKFDSHDFWHRFAKAGLRSLRVPHPLYYYRRGHPSMSSGAMVA